MDNSLHRQALVMPLLLLLFLTIGIPGLQARETESARIERLLRVVAVSRVSFIIEGTVYNADEMARHLRAKLERVGQKNLTMEFFISRIANSSSQGGKPYKVALENGQTTYAGPWLRGLLHDIEQGRLQTVLEANASSPSIAP